MTTQQPTDLDVFPDMLARNDLNLMARDVFGEKYSDVKHILYPTPAYRAFPIKKRDGGIRIIHEPSQALKNLQLKALEYLQKQQNIVRPCVHGFVKGRSILTNAQAHCDREASFLLNIDLKDFFPSITFFRVRGIFQKPPFSFSFEVATVFAQLCTHNGSLPQGAPTSPYLSNLVCRSLDRDLMALAKRHRCTYTRYADDMTFSFSVRSASILPEKICRFDGGAVVLGEDLRAIISRHTFSINEKKTRISSRNTRQEVTGLIINKFPNVSRRFVDEVRGALHAWDKHGYQAAQKVWEERVVGTKDRPVNERAWPRQTRCGSPPKLYNYLWGKLLFIRMVRREDDPLYNRLAERYNALIGSAVANNSKAPRLPVHFEVQSNEHAHKALYVVEWDGDAPRTDRSGETEYVGGQGTAFAYRRRDMLVTCEHVFRSELEGGGQSDYKNVKGAKLNAIHVATNTEWPATVLHRDQGRDLAVLRIDKPRSNMNMRHFVANPSPAGQMQAGLLLGFPNWTKSRQASIQQATVTSVFTKGALKRFEIDSMIRKGNSGGPVVAAGFGVLGIAQEGATQAEGNNQCLCVSELDNWLDSLHLDRVFQPNTA
ncbi:MAG: reverse transcriptase domain-containing protein [Leptothrix ochracea]